MTRLQWFLVAALCIVGMTLLNVCGVLYGDSAARWVPFQVGGTVVTLAVMVRAARVA